jgi:hypothetical protein
MIPVPLFGGEKLELGDYIKHQFPINIEMVYEVVGANAIYAFVVCISNGEPNMSHQIRIPRLWEPHIQQQAYRNVNTPVMH